MKRNFFKPKLMVQRLEDIKLDNLKYNGKIQGLIIDIDNTLVAWNHNLISMDTILWLEKAKYYGFKLCLLSNGFDNRVKNIASCIDINYECKAVKPLMGKHKKILKKFALAPQYVAFIGDQIFTDIFSGNYLNLYTILVEPLSNRDFLFTRFTRKAEKYILKRECGGKL